MFNPLAFLPKDKSLDLGQAERDKRWPGRYYVLLESSGAEEPAKVLGWHDVYMYSDPASSIPKSEYLIRVSPDVWENTPRTGVRYLRGEFIPYQELPVVPAYVRAVDIATQAAALLWENYGVFGDPVPDECKAYLRAVKDIAKKRLQSATFPDLPEQLKT